MAADTKGTTNVRVREKWKRERIWSTALYSVVASGPAFLVGCTLAFPSAALLDLNDFSSTQSDLFGGLAPIGALFGGFLGGSVMDQFGRKAALLTVTLPYLIGYLSIVYSQMISNNTGFLVALFGGRFVTGIGLGWSCAAVPVYHSEISSSKVRGLFGSFTQLFLSAGVMFLYLLSAARNLTFYDDSLIIIAVLAAFEVLMYFLLPESPRWLLAHGHKQLAVHTLKRLRGPKHPIDGEINAIEADILKYPHVNVFKRFHELISSCKVFSSLLTILVIMSLQQLSGLNAISAYATVIFEEAGVSDPAESASYAVGGTALLFTFLSIFVIDIFGRKVLLVASGVGMLVGTVLLGVHFYMSRPAACLNESSLSIADSEDVICNSNLAPLAIISIMLFNAAFSIGWGPVPWVLLGELLPLRVRGLGSSMVTFVNWGSAAIVTGLYFKYSELVSTWFTWWTFSVFNLCGIVFVTVFLRETKKKELENI